MRGWDENEYRRSREDVAAVVADVAVDTNEADVVVADVPDVDSRVTRMRRPDAVTTSSTS